MIVGENARSERHGREPHQGEEAHQHARRRAPTTPSAWCRRGRCRSSRRSSSSPTTSASRSRRTTSGCARSSSTPASAAAPANEPEPRALPSLASVRQVRRRRVGNCRSSTARATTYHRARHASAAPEPGRVPADHARGRGAAGDHHRHRRRRCGSRLGPRVPVVAELLVGPAHRARARPTRTSGSSRSTACSPAWCRSR